MLVFCLGFTNNNPQRENPRKVMKNIQSMLSLVEFIFVSVTTKSEKYLPVGTFHNNPFIWDKNTGNLNMTV